MQSDADTLAVTELIEQARNLMPYSTIVVVRTFIDDKVGARISLPSMPGRQWKIEGDIDRSSRGFDRTWARWIRHMIATIVDGAELPLELDDLPKLLGEDGLPLRCGPNAPTILVGSLTPAAAGFVFLLVPKTDS